jgi:hypothetical protein
VIRLKTNEDVGAFTFDLETPSGEKKTIAISNPPSPEVNAIKLELEKFRDAIINNTPTVVSELDGYRAMDVAHQILHKIKSSSSAFREKS